MRVRAKKEYYEHYKLTHPNEWMHAYILPEHGEHLHFCDPVTGWVAGHQDHFDIEESFPEDKGRIMKHFQMMLKKLST